MPTSTTKVALVTGAAKRIGAEIADDVILEWPEVGSPLADMIDRELDMAVESADREFIARNGIALEFGGNGQAREKLIGLRRNQ